jgi:hypothetical protein
MRFAAIAALVLLAAAPPATAELSVGDVIRLHLAELETETLVSLVQASGQVFRLEADEILAMKEAGVPETVIRAMIQTAMPGQEDSRAQVVMENGSILLTNVGAGGEDEPAGPDRTNVIPSDPARTPLPAIENAFLAPMSLPPAQLTVEQTVYTRSRSHDRGNQWHPSWDEGRRAYYPTEAYVTTGGGYGWGWAGRPAGYYYLPAAYGPEGPSSFGRFGFHLNTPGYHTSTLIPPKLLLHPAWRKAYGRGK